jgi:hypothetical protein
MTRNLSLVFPKPVGPGPSSELVGPHESNVADDQDSGRLIEAGWAPNNRSRLSRARQGYGSGVGYALLADLVMVLHFTFLACVVFGGFLALKWPRLILAHVLLVAWGFH